MPLRAQHPNDAPTTTSERPWAIRRLPPFPAVALQLLSLLDDEEVSMRQIVSLLRVDPALSAEILRVSNSALYGLSRRIDNVSHAVVVLGTEVVKRLALTVAIGRFARSNGQGAAFSRYWDHSVAVALLAERLASQMRHPRDRGYTAGLLHDVGLLALLCCYPDEYGSMADVVREHDFNQLECEREMFDIDHCAAGEWLAREWNLPDDLVAAIARHHDADLEGGGIASIVRAADRLTGPLGFALIERQPAEHMEDALEGLPLEDPHDFLERLDGVEDDIRTAIQAFTPR